MIVGTPIGDTFVIGSNYIAGAGRFVNYSGIQSIEVDGAGGNDTIYVLGTASGTTTTINGGPGDNIIHIGGDPQPLVFNPPPYSYQPPAIEVPQPARLVTTQQTQTFTNLTLNVDAIAFDVAFIANGNNLTNTLLQFLGPFLSAFGSRIPGYSVVGTPVVGGITNVTLYSFFNPFQFAPVVQLTVSSLAITYDTQTLVPQAPIFIQPPKVIVNQPPYAFQATENLNSSAFQGPLIIDGGQGEQVSGNTVIFHDQGGTPGPGFLRLDTFPQLTSIGQVTPAGATSPVPLWGQNGSLTQTYLTLGGFGLGIPTTGLPAYPGIQLTSGLTDPMYDGVELTDVQHLEVLLPNGGNSVAVESVPASLNLTIDPGSGSNTINLDSSGASTTIDGGAGTNAIVVGQQASVQQVDGQTRAVGSSESLQQILGQLTVNGTAHLLEQTVPQTGAQVGTSLLSNLPLVFINTQTAAGSFAGSSNGQTLTFVAAGGGNLATITRNSGNWSTDGFLAGDRIAVSGTGTGENDGIYIVSTITGGGRVLNLASGSILKAQSGVSDVSVVAEVHLAPVVQPIDPNNVAGPLEIWTSVLDSTGAIIMDQVQEWGSQEYGVQATDGNGNPLFLDSEGNPTTDGTLTGVPVITQVAQGTPGARAVYFDANNNQVFTVTTKAVYAADFTDGSPLYVDGEGNLTTTPTNQPFDIPVRRSNAIAWTILTDSQVTQQGTNTLTIDDASEPNSVTGSLDVTQIPVNQLVNGQPVYDGGAASPVQKFYYGGEPVLDPFTGQPLHYSGGEPVLNLLTGLAEFGPTGAPLIHNAGDPMLHIAGDPVAHLNGDQVVYLGGELTRDANGHLVPTAPAMTGSPTLSFVAVQGGNLATITRSAGSWILDGFTVGDEVLVSGTVGARDDGVYMITAMSTDGTTLSVVSSTVSVIAQSNDLNVSVQNLLTYGGGESAIHNPGDPVLDVVNAHGQPVAVGTAYTPPVFNGPFGSSFNGTLNLNSLAGFSYRLKAGDVVHLVAYRGTAILDLPASDYTVNTAANTITISNPSATLAGVSEIALSIATQAYHAAGDPMYYFGNEPLQVGQPVVNSTGSLVLDSNGQVELYTPATIGQNATQFFTFVGGVANTETFTLNSAPNGFIDVTVAGTDLSSAEYSVTGTQVTVTPSFMPAQGSQVVITYRLSILDHSVGEPVYILSPQGTWVPRTYSGGQPAVYFGTEPNLDYGGEPVYYTSTQPLQQAQNTHVVVMTGGMPGSVNFTGVSNLTITGGTGNNTFTIVQTQIGAFGTAGTDSTPVTFNTGNGNDQVAVRSIESPVTVQAGSGTDTIDVGTLAGLWPDPSTGRIVFENINGIVGDISALLTVNGGAGNATLNVDDTGDSLSQVGRLTSTQITGLGMAVGIDYSSITTLNINLGPGNDFFTIASTATGTTTNLQGGPGDQVLNVQSTAHATTINLGGGQETVNVGSQAGVGGWNFDGTLAGIQGALTVHGAASPGFDSLVVDDSADTLARTGVLTSTTLTGLGMTPAGITYTSVAALYLRLGSGSDGFNVAGTGTGTTSINGGPSSDTFTVTTVSGPTEIQGDDPTVPAFEPFNNLVDAGFVLVHPILTTPWSATVVANGTTLTYGNQYSYSLGSQRINFKTPVTGSVDVYFNDPTEPAPTTFGGLVAATSLTVQPLLESTAAVNVLVNGVAQAYGVGYTFALGSRVINFTTPVTGTVLVEFNSNFTRTVAVPQTITGHVGSYIVNVDAAGNETHVNGIGALLAIDPQYGTNTITAYLTGQTNPESTPVSQIDVHDSGTGDIDTLNIYGANNPQVGDQFLVRAGFVAMLQIANGQTIAAERVNYDATMNGGLRIYGRQGNDYFALDDTTAALTIIGGQGSDVFQVGQLFTTSNLDPQYPFEYDSLALTKTTQGWISNGISQPATLEGGNGDDTFNVYRNLANLTLIGGPSTNVFTVRAFALYGSQPNDTARRPTSILGGGGENLIQYAVNAPVNILGGPGTNTVNVLATELGDTFVITPQGVFGAGLFATMIGIQYLNIEGLAGDNTFEVLGTDPGVVTHIYGGVGSNAFDVGGSPNNQPTQVAANDQQGYSQLINQGTSSTDPSYENVVVGGISANVADANSAGVVVTPIGPLQVVAGPLPTGSFAPTPAGDGSTYSEYSVVLTHQPQAGQVVRVNISGSGLPNDQAQPLEFYTSAFPQFLTTTYLTFDATNWSTPQTVYVVAPPDAVAPGAQANQTQTFAFGPNGGTSASFGLAETPNSVVSVTVAGAAIPSSQYSVSGATLNLSLSAPAAGNASVVVDYLISVGATTAEYIRNSLTVTTPPNVVIPTYLDYTSVTARSLTIQVVASNVGGVVLTPTSPTTGFADSSTTVFKGGAGDTFSVRLSTAPLAGEIVTVNLTATNGLVLTSGGNAVTSLTFNSTDWNVPVTVAVNLAQDGVVQGPFTAFVRSTVTTSFTAANGSLYTNISPVSLTVSVVDDNAAGVLTQQVGGTTNLMEVGPTFGSVNTSGAPYTASYTVVLTKRPSANVTVTETPISTPTGGMLDQQFTYSAPTNGQFTLLMTPALASAVQVSLAGQILDPADYTVSGRVVSFTSAVGAANGGLVNITYEFSGTASNLLLDGHAGPLTLTFTPADWNIPQTVTVGAVDDNVINGAQVKVIAAQPRTVNQIQGPLYINGGVDPSVSLTTPPPLLFLGETDSNTFVPQPNPALQALPSQQVNVLNVLNNDSVASLGGVLTATTITGLGMGSPVVIQGQTYPGGITYADIQDLQVDLGQGNDQLQVSSTDVGSTTIVGGAGADQVNIQTTGGLVTVDGGSGTSTIDVGTNYNGTYLGVNINHFAAPAGGVLAELGGLLRINGGTGTSTVNLDDSGNPANSVSVLTGSNLSGLDLHPSVVQVVTVSHAIGGSFKLQVGQGGPITSALPYQLDAAGVQAALSALNLPNVTAVTVSLAGNTYTIGFVGGPQIAGEDLTLIADATGLVSDSSGTAASVQIRESSIDIVQSVTVQAALGTFPVAIGNNLATVNLTVGETANQFQDDLIAAIAGTGLIHSANNVPLGINDVLVELVGSTYYVTYQGLLAGTAGQPFTLSVAPIATVTPQGATSVLVGLSAVGGTYTIEAGNGLVTYSLPWNATAGGRPVGTRQPARQQPDRRDGDRLGLLDHGAAVRGGGPVRRRFEPAPGPGRDRLQRPGDRLQQRHDAQPRPGAGRQRGEHPRDDGGHRHLRPRRQSAVLRLVGGQREPPDRTDRRLPVWRPLGHPGQPQPVRRGRHAQAVHQQRRVGLGDAERPDHERPDQPDPAAEQRDRARRVRPRGHRLLGRSRHGRKLRRRHHLLDRLRHGECPGRRHVRADRRHQLRRQPAHQHHHAQHRPGDARCDRQPGRRGRRPVRPEHAGSVRPVPRAGEQQHGRRIRLDARPDHLRRPGDEPHHRRPGERHHLRPPRRGALHQRPRPGGHHPGQRRTGRHE